VTQTVASPSAAADRPTRVPDAVPTASAGHLFLFVITAYLLAWLCFGVPILAARGLIALPAPEAAFLTLATLGVCLAGIGAAAVESGRSGVRALLAQVPRWRVRPVWYLAALFVPALFPAGGFLLSLALGTPPPPAPPLQVWLSLPLLLIALVIPAILEEVGWRGYALPRLQRRFGALRASLILGVIWAGLHLPLWLLPDFGFADQSIPLYLVQVLAFSVVLAWLYNATGGSLLLTGMAHAAINGWPTPWGASLQSLPVEVRAAPISEFHILITAATLAFAVVVVIATRGLTRSAWPQSQRRV
jgi:membrane protease YdiL (CAAX protease family)